uniref:Uncharacterized protein n=1 Tax=Rhizophora mucronata TaxID=61149 RepID=A0A2P2PW35_RHIMU
MCLKVIQGLCCFNPIFYGILNKPKKRFWF